MKPWESGYLSARQQSGYNETSGPHDAVSAGSATGGLYADWRALADSMGGVFRVGQYGYRPHIEMPDGTWVDLPLKEEKA